MMTFGLFIFSLPTVPNTTLQVQTEFNGILTAPFTSNIGSPQGDIYLEAAIQYLRSHGLVRPEADKLIGLPESLVYADNTYFFSFLIGNTLTG